MSEQEPQDPVTDYLKAHAAATQQAPQGDPVADYLAAHKAAAPVAPKAAEHGPVWNAVQGGAAHLLSAAQVVPGVEELEAGMGALGSHFPGQKTMTYAESLKNLRGETDKINPLVKTAEQTVASIPMMGEQAIARLTPMAAGALFGGLHGATKADAGLSSGDVVGNTAGGLGIGALIGKASDVATTGIRALKAKTLGQTALSRDAARSQAAATNYGDALGNANPPTPAVQSVINNQDFGPLAAKLEQSPSFRGMARTDPKFLHEIYKGLSDESAALDKGLVPPDPSKGNSKRRQVGDIRLLKNQLIDALEAPSMKPPLVLDIPASSVSTEPNIIPGYSRAAISGPQTSYTAPPVTTAQSPRPTLRDAINDFHARPAIAFARKEGTVEQQMAREALERHSAEDIAAPSLRGSPPGERTSTSTAFTMPAVDRQPQFISPGVSIQTPAMRVQTAPAETGPPMMPGYRHAVEDYATRSRDIDAFNKSADATKRAINPKDIAAKNLTKKSPEAFAQAVQSMSPDEAQAGTEGALGRLKEHLNMSANPLKLFGAGPSLANIGRASPIVRQLDQQSGNSLPDLLAKLGIVSSASALRQ